MAFIKICNKIIEYSFYAIFLLVPWALWKDTSELFELNKMWLTWGLTIIITMSWLIKMILQRQFIFKRTLLDIPIGLFLLSQIISTIFSLDSHVSLWGYYSRFNGGLLSIVSYIFLYYAFLSNSPTAAKVQRLLGISLISGLIVTLWGLPSHFGYDPTCLIFRGTFDVSCWTADFMPKVRIFSTLGQPDWLAAYLAILIPISIAAYLLTKNKSRIFNSLFIILYSLFYLALLYTRARSGVLGIWIALIFFFGAYIFIKRKKLNFSSLTSHLSPLISLIGIILAITFFIGTPITQLNKFTLEGIKDTLKQTQTPVQAVPEKAESGGPVPKSGTEGGTESGHIRLLVWEGAINAWKANPVFGTGVETFAYAYYKYKPLAQNLTSEWNFLYNKAHNEYLNYLATTGIVGLGTYLGMIGFFLTIVMLNLFQHLNSLKNETLKQVQGDTGRLLILALLAGYISILVTNFFGFSVVMTNIYLFMIPAFVLVLMGMIKVPIAQSNKSSTFFSRSIDSRGKSRGFQKVLDKPARIMIYDVSIWQWPPTFFVFIAGLYMIIMLFRFWQADIAYALGSNLDRAGEYEQAYKTLRKAVELRSDEPVFKDELSINDALIATSLVTQKGQNKTEQEQALSFASNLAQEAINTSNEIVSQYQNNIVFWKTRVRLFYTLSQVDSRYLPRALDAIEKAAILAPQDASILYNLGILYGQNNDIPKGMDALEKTIKFKPDYQEAHYALGLFYRQMAVDKNGKVIDLAYQQKAIDRMQFILIYINPKHAGAKDSLKSWGK